MGFLDFLFDPTEKRTEREDCSDCHGSGVVYDHSEKCSSCNGRGWVEGFFGEKVCSACNGEGSFSKYKTCPRCEGRGYEVSVVTYCRRCGHESSECTCDIPDRDPFAQ